MMWNADVKFVIPGRRTAASPESILRSATDYGFRVPAFVRPRNDERNQRELA